MKKRATRKGRALSPLVKTEVFTFAIFNEAGDLLRDWSVVCDKQAARRDSFNLAFATETFTLLDEIRHTVRNGGAQ